MGYLGERGIFRGSLKYDFETKSIVGGKYAVTEYLGDYAVAEEAWVSLYAWVEKNNYTFRDEPAFEKY